MIYCTYTIQSAGFSMMFHYQRAYLQYMSILRYFKMASLGGTPFISILQSGLHLCLEVPLQLWWHPDFQRTGLHLAEIIATAINGHLDHPDKTRAFIFSRSASTSMSFLPCGNSKFSLHQNDVPNLRGKINDYQKEAAISGVFRSIQVHSGPLMVH